MRNVDIVETGFTDQTNLTAIEYSVTYNGLSRYDRFSSQFKVVRINRITESMCSVLAPVFLILKFYL